MSASSIAAVRGAIVVPANTPLAIRAASARLLSALIERNALTPERVVSAVFTSTPDLTADFPAHAARLLGWSGVPLLGATEVAVPGAPARVVRVLLTVTGVTRRKPLEPVYLDGAEVLRPDLSVREAESRLRAGRGGKAMRAAAPRPAPPRAATVSPAPNTRRVAILGLGQIGGSIGLALGVAGGWHRVGFDASAAVRRAALATRAVDEVARTLEQACAGAELVVVAVPVDVLPRVVAAAALALPRGAALLDTGSARRGVTEALAAAAKAGVRAVGGHPIAGSEGRGLWRRARRCSRARRSCCCRSSAAACRRWRAHWCGRWARTSAWPRRARDGRSPGRATCRGCSRARCATWAAPRRGAASQAELARHDAPGGERPRAWRVRMRARTARTWRAPGASPRAAMDARGGTGAARPVAARSGDRHAQRKRRDARIVRTSRRRSGEARYSVAGSAGGAGSGATAILPSTAMYSSGSLCAFAPFRMAST